MTSPAHAQRSSVIIACGLLVVLGAAGCSSKPHTAIELSKAKISNLHVKDLGNHEQGYYKLGIEFDYAIENFQEVSDLYRCTVQIMMPDGQSSRSAWTGTNCEIKQAYGHKRMLVTTPQDKVLRNRIPDRYQPKHLANSDQYMIVVLQMLSPQRSQSIGIKRFQAPNGKKALPKGRWGRMLTYSSRKAYSRGARKRKPLNASVLRGVPAGQKALSRSRPPVGSPGIRRAS